MPRYIDADKMVSKDNAYTTFPHDLAACDDNDLVRWINEQHTADVVPKSKYDLAVAEREANVKGFIEQVEALSREIKALRAFKEYWDELYGQGLTVAGWHENGAYEDFDNFYDCAEMEYDKQYDAHTNAPTKVSSGEIVKDSEHRCMFCQEIVPQGRDLCGMCETAQEFWRKRKE